MWDISISLSFVILSLVDSVVALTYLQISLNIQLRFIFVSLCSVRSETNRLVFLVNYIYTCGPVQTHTLVDNYF